MDLQSIPGGFAGLQAAHRGSSDQLHFKCSRNNGKTGMIHMVSDLVGTLCEQIMMVLGKVTVQIFCMTSLKIKTRVLGLSEMHSE